MQGTITARRISYFWIALVATALLVGFAAGRATIPSAFASANTATLQVQPQSAQRLLQLNEQLYPSNATTMATVPQRNLPLYNLNELYYPSSGNEPTFWNGRPH